MKKLRTLNPVFVVLPLLACFILVPAAGYSQDWAGLSKQLRDRCAKFNQGVKDMTMTMEMTNVSSEGSFQTQATLFRKGDRFRAEVKMPKMPGGGDMPPEFAEMTTLVIDDGKGVWMINPMTGKIEVPSNETSKYRGQWDCGDYVPEKAEITGGETVSGRDCHVVVVKDATSSYARLWIDKKTLDLMKLEGKPQDGETTVTLFSDFKKVAGDWQVPHKTELYQKDKVVSTIIITSMEANKGLSDDLFDADKAQVKGPNMMDMMKKMKDQQKEEDKQE